MHYAKLASLLTLILIQSQQGGEDASLPKFVLIPFLLLLCSIVFFLFAATSIAFCTLFFGTFALPPVLGLQALYRRAVLRWMSIPGGSARAPEERPVIPQTQTHAPSNLRIEVQDTETSRGPDAYTLNRRAQEASRAVTRVYVLAAAAYTVAMTPLAVYVCFGLRTVDSTLASVGAVSLYLSAFVVLMWLPVLIYLVTALGRPWLKLLAVVAYSLLLSTPALLLPAEEATSVCLLLAIMWSLLMSAPTSTMLVLRISGVGGLSLGMIFSLTAPALLLAFKFILMTFDPVLQKLPAEAHGPFKGPGDAVAFAATVLLLGGPIIAAIVASGLLWLMSYRYARKRTSEQLLLLDIFWLVTTFIISLAAYLSAAGWYAMLGPLPFALYKLVVWAGLRRLEQNRGERRELRLLLLRVFGAKRRSEWLLKRLGNYWLYAGSIQLIAAPDLASANLDLDELLDFLRGRLKSRFIKGMEDCARRVESLDVLPDPDGRYRVNEFFCHDDMWHETIAALTRRSDAVLMDLRGFTPRNRGCVDEVHHLFDAVALNRLVITVNDETDHVSLRRTFEDAWARMGERSPNRRMSSPVLRLLHIRRENSRAVRRLLSMLCEASESEAADGATHGPPIAARASAELHA